MQKSEVLNISYGYYSSHKSAELDLEDGVKVYAPLGFDYEKGDTVEYKENLDTGEYSFIKLYKK